MEHCPFCCRTECTLEISWKMHSQFLAEFSDRFMHFDNSCHHCLRILCLWYAEIFGILRFFYWLAGSYKMVLLLHVVFVCQYISWVRLYFPLRRCCNPISRSGFLRVRQFVKFINYRSFRIPLVTITFQRLVCSSL